MDITYPLMLAAAVVGTPLLLVTLFRISAQIDNPTLTGGTEHDEPRTGTPVARQPSPGTVPGS